MSDELIFVPQEHAGTTYYHLETPSKGRFYRVAYPEYVFLSLLDGKTSLAQAVTLSARALGAQALTQSQSMDVALWLLENDLARIADDPNISRKSPPQQRGSLSTLNPFWIKVPLVRPDRILSGLEPLTSWFFSPLMSLVGAFVIVAGVAVIAAHWAQFIASSHLIFSPHNWLSMAMAWAMLKLVHETSHSLVCKRYGGEVREAGIIFILLAPAAFVDVTSSWRFPSKWQRIHVAVAGMYTELLLAAIAAMIWSQAESVVLRHLLFNTILMASISTLLFNGNPLMRFDGYYILADFLEIPNLATEGGQFVRRLATHVLFGRVTRAKSVLGAQGWMIRVYGVAASLWRLFVCASLIAAASVLFKGAGLALGVVAIFSWFGRPLVNCIKAVHRQFYEAPLPLLRAAFVITFLAGISYAVLMWVPMPSMVTAPIVVEYDDLSIVRSRTAGFIEKVHVRDGMQVAKGDLLLELRNDELQTEYLELQESISQADLLHRAAINRHDAASAQVALRSQEAHRQRLAELERQRRGLTVHAPVAGRIVGRQLENSIGTYVKEGTELLAVGDERRKELLVSVSHEQIDAIASLIGQNVQFRTRSLRLFEGRLARLEPRASRRLPHPALSAIVDGPLPVSQTDADNPTECQLVEPRFPGIIHLPADVSPHLSCGERGYAILGLNPMSIGQHLWTRLSHWLGRLGKLRQQS